MKASRAMDEGAAAWSGLGLNMNLPSSIKEEMERLKLELRDLKLQVSKDFMAVQDTMSSVIGDLVSVVERQRSLLTRVEGMEARAQSTGVASSPSDPFNAFAYISLDEIEDSILNSDEEVETVGPNVVEPVGPAASDEIISNKDNGEIRVFSNEDVAAEFLELVGDHIDEVGGILNNILFTKLWKGTEAASPEIKKLVKAALLADDTIIFHKLSKMRGIYCRVGGDPDEIYKELYG